GRCRMNECEFPGESRPSSRPVGRWRRLAVGPAAVAVVLAILAAARGEDAPGASPAGPSLMGVAPAIFDVGSIDEAVNPASAAADEGPSARDELERAARTVGLFAAVSLAPVAVLMA